MKATLEISYYPLTDNYRQHIIDFIQNLRESYSELSFEINGLSTQIFGDYSLISKIFEVDLKNELEKGKCVFVLKLAPTERRKENLPIELK